LSPQIPASIELQASRRDGSNVADPALTPGFALRAYNGQRAAVAWRR
jgi:hypothetical protein